MLLALMAHEIGGQSPVDVMLPVPRGMRLNARTVLIVRPQGSFPGSCLLSLAIGVILFSHGTLYETLQFLEIVA